MVRPPIIAALLWPLLLAEIYTVLLIGEHDTLTIFRVNGVVLDQVATLSLGKGAVRLLALDLTEVAAL